MKFKYNLLMMQVDINVYLDHLKSQAADVGVDAEATFDFFIKHNLSPIIFVPGRYANERQTGKDKSRRAPYSLGKPYLTQLEKIPYTPTPEWARHIVTLTYLRYLGTSAVINDESAAKVFAYKEYLKIAQWFFSKYPSLFRFDEPLGTEGKIVREIEAQLGRKIALDRKPALKVSSEKVDRALSEFLAEVQPARKVTPPPPPLEAATPPLEAATPPATPPLPAPIPDKHVQVSLNHVPHAGEVLFSFVDGRINFSIPKNHPLAKSILDSLTS